MNNLTPLEINKRIAELKGYKVTSIGVIDGCDHCGNTDDNLILCMKIEDYQDNRPWLYWSEKFNWAENISDAWKLFEEMPYSKVALWSKAKPDQRYSTSFTDEISKIGMQYFYAETAPLAICQAWLKWKGVR